MPKLTTDTQKHNNKAVVVRLLNPCHCFRGSGRLQADRKRENRMRWALENKSRLIPAFGYEKSRPAGKRIKASAKLAYIQRVRGDGVRERPLIWDSLRGAKRGSLLGPRLATHTHYSPALQLRTNTHAHTLTPSHIQPCTQIRNIHLLFSLSGTLNPKIQQACWEHLHRNRQTE